MEDLKSWESVEEEPLAEQPSRKGPSLASVHEAGAQAAAAVAGPEEASEALPPAAPTEVNTVNTAVRLALPSGALLDIRELTEPAEQPTADAEPEAETKAKAEAEASWRLLNTSRRWSGAVQQVSNQLRSEGRGAGGLKRSFLAATSRGYLPAGADLEAMLANAPPALEPLLRRLRAPAKAGEEQLAAAKRALLIAIGALFAPEGAVPAVCRSVVTEAVPASFAVTVEAEAAPAAAAGLISELVARGEARIDSISLTVDLAEANKRRSAAAQESKDAARAALLFGRPLTGRERPADDAVPCVVTLKGPDPRCLAAVGEEIGRELRKGGAKRPRDAGGSRDDGERSNRRSR